MRRAAPQFSQMISEEPPPMSNRTINSASRSASSPQPATARAASVSRSTISSCSPRRSRTLSRNSAPFSAARHASVAIRRARVTPRAAILSRQMRSASRVRSIAASLSRPVCESPSPKRTMREKASTTRNPSAVGRATRRRQLLVPKSSAAYGPPGAPRSDAEWPKDEARRGARAKRGLNDED